MTGRASGRYDRGARSRVLRFGEIARKLGYITEDMLSEGLKRQRARVEGGESHKLLGLILLELGHIDSQQLIEILRRFEAEQRSSGETAIPA